MSAPWAELSCPDLPGAPTARVAAGALIGRGGGCVLRLPHPSISEVHAVVSLRGRALRLVACSGLLGVDGERVREVSLSAGQSLGLVDGVALHVREVFLPSSVLMLESADRRHALGAALLSVVITPDGLDLVPRFDPGAPARVWEADGAWWIFVAGATHPITPGGRWEIEQHPLEAVLVPLGAAAVAATHGAGRYDPPMLAELWYSTARILVDGRAPVTLDGVGARILRELAELGEPVEWSVVAGEVWREAPAGLRDRWDMALRRLRDRLRELGIRDDLVRSDGRGIIGLALQSGDRVELR